MKKLFLMLAAFALCAAPSCSSDDSNGKDNSNNPAPSTGELRVPVTVEVEQGVGTVGYAATEALIDGQAILDFFGMTAEEFYTAMGELNGDDAVNGNSSQSENTLEFGTYYEGVYTFKPQSAGNLGHWFRKNGDFSYWTDTEHYFFIESWSYWGAAGKEEPDFSYDDMWYFGVGFEEGAYDMNEGDEVKATQIIYESKTDKTVFIEWTIKIVGFVDPEAGQFNPADRKVGETNLTFTETLPISQYADYEGLLIPADDIQAALQLTKFQISGLENSYEAATDEEGNEIEGALISGLEAVALNADGEPIAQTAGGIVGNWLNKESGSTTWLAEDSVLCIELQSDPTTFQTHVCIQPENSSMAGEDSAGTAVDAAVGSTITYKIRLTYIPEAGAEPTIVNVTYEITLA